MLLAMSYSVSGLNCGLYISLCEPLSALLGDSFYEIGDYFETLFTD